MLPNNPEVTDDNTEERPSLSVLASYFSFQDQNNLHTQPKGASNKNSPDETEMEGDQIYWQASIEEFNDPLEFSPEIPFSIAGATKVSWEKSTADIIEEKMENAKIPSNCYFLVSKRANKKFLSLSQVSIRQLKIRCGNSRKLKQSLSPCS